MPWWGSNRPKLLETAEFHVIDDLKISTQLGAGSYGTVYCAEYDGTPCVAKEIHPYLTKITKDGRDGPTPLDICIKEINTLSSLRHPSIVQFLGVYFRNKSHVPILVMERMWKSLSTILDERPNQLPLLIKTHILYDVACGLQYLHGQKNPVVHRDLNANNILLTKSLEAKIGDLGQAKALVSEHSVKLSTKPGNPAHMPPEALKHKPTYDSKLDIFSFGCTIIHTITENFPLPTDQYVPSESDPNSFVIQPEVERREEFINQLTSSKHYTFQQIAIQCLQDAPINRPTAPDLCKDLEKLVRTSEAELPKLAKQYKEDKLFLIRLLNSEEIELEHAQKETKKVQEEIKSQSHSFQMKLAEQKEINEKLSATCKNEVDRLRGEITAKKDEVEEANAKIAELQRKVQMKFEKEIATQEELAELKKINNHLTRACKTEVDQLKIELNIKEDAVKQADESIVKLQQEIQTYQIKVVNEATKLSEKDDKIANLEGNIQEVNDTLRAYMEENSILLTAKKDLISKNSVLTQELTELRKRCKVQQSTLNKQKDEISSFQSKQRGKIITNTGSHLHQILLELQHINENEHQQLQQKRQSYVDAINHKEEIVVDLSAQLSDMQKKHATLKQQLDEKSYSLITLESSHSKLQKNLSTIEEELKLTEKGNAALQKIVENKKDLYRKLQKEYKDKDESLKRKESEVEIQKREHADEIRNLNSQHSRKVQSLEKGHDMQVSQTAVQEVAVLMKEETQCRSDLIKITEDRFKQLQNELKGSTKIQKDLKRQIKQHEKIIKEKDKYIKDLENTRSIKPTDLFQFNIQWYAHLSLPVKMIRASATILKDRVFVSGGYQQRFPQGKDLNSILESLENGNRLFCFHTTKCRYDSIASPVVLGGVAIVNGQCVLVSGAERNTLTGNVYVLCEEGSDEQWKKFSEPVPTPRILPCVCCYQGKWLIVCGGYTCKEGSNLLEVVNVMEMLDIRKGEWYTLPDEKYPGVSTVLCCTVVAENLYVTGDGKFFKNNFDKVTTAVTRKSASDIPQWSDVDLQIEELRGNLHPFSVVEVNGQPMIIASISGSEDDVTCVLMKDTTDTWRKMSEAVECQHCSAVVVTPTLELLLFGGSEKVASDEPTDICQCGALTPSLNIRGKYYNNRDMHEV